MPVDADHYQAYYSDKLWNLLPAIYRSLDSPVFNANGPLRELVNRIGAQAGILRRSIDRLWEDQSIETCDDWVIAYIADLLATNLVSSLDARGQRLDVANTIYYRRRKGTVAILEQIAWDITGWDARVVEFFRRLSRTRHNFDPPIGAADETAAQSQTLALAEGLLGLWTNTQAGGWADLRNVYGAIQAQSPFAIAPAQRPPVAFDEYFHTADFRAGNGRSGWYNIPNLGVFVWRLISFGSPQLQSTPVQQGNCYTFDPTGRAVPLFAVSSRPSGDNWVSPQEWQLPTPISTPLLASALTDPADTPLYASLASDGFTLEPNFSLGIFTKPGSFYELIPSSQATTLPRSPLDAHQFVIMPELGRFEMLYPAAGPLTVNYYYGFSAPIGAGPYDRRLIGGTPNPTSAPSMSVSGGGGALQVSGAVPPVGTVTVNDSLTYSGAADLVAVEQLTLQAQNNQRPAVRFAPKIKEWTITGDPGSSLVIEGLLISGADIVLEGSFDSVTFTCCTFDPGTAADPALFAKSIDKRDLRPTRVWIEAEITQLSADRCILGPIRTRANGEVETLTITNSIVQSIPTSDSATLTEDNVKDPYQLALRLQTAADPLALYLFGRLSKATQKLLKSALPNPPAAKLFTALLTDLNALIAGPGLIFDPAKYPITLTAEARQLSLGLGKGTALARLNYLLLTLAFPLELADFSLGFSSGVSSLSRCTVLGPAYVHRLEASECILDDVVTVEDTQDGCVRFTAWATGSVLPRQYQCAQVAANAPLFASRLFGQPDYAQLLDGVDNAIVTADTGGTISAGAADGSEMGAFAMQKNPIKERSLLVKYQEYMPLGLNPIVIHVT
jgi:hypothetical protein